MSSKRPPRRLLACAALSAGVLLASATASAETPKPCRPAPQERSSFAALVDAALRLVSNAPSADAVALQPQRRMGNSKGPGYTDRSAVDSVSRAEPVQARRPPRTSR